MAMNDGKLDALIQQIYDAALEDALWPALIHELALLIQASDSLLFSLPGSSHQTPFILAPLTHADADAWADYASYYRQHDIWMLETKKQGLMRPGAIIHSDRLVERRAFRQSEIYRDLLKPKLGGAEVNMGLVMLDEPLQDQSPPLFLSLYKSAFDETFTAQDEGLIRHLLPHLQRALRIRWKLIREREMRQLREQALEQVAVAIVLLDAAGRLLFANRQAERLLSQGGNPTVIRGYLGGLDAYENNAIKQALRQARQGIGSTLRLNNTQAIGTRVATFSPVTAPFSEQLGTPARIIVMITEPDTPAFDDLRAFSKLYQLTPAETRVLKHLLQHRSPQEIADTLHVSIKTVRTQLSALFAKTQTDNQRELVQFSLSHLFAGSMQIGE
ncbi:helix-turn-helix transcriptional regulator [Methylomicrobium sp. RS1]|uniref:helix-turn-helix transcriptional regulator n=1 Tax=Candidatus Methylomicrobium oryzae TaxID=2802053 RepID=UPI0019243AB3|nr:helix-turn-helix transcriptional regulator [Methylomicrobium sp. RS1]MBL1262683.1 helix-turn-helix transcriptional regulator [Methylomicrobium sp. RS1]